MNDPQNDPAMPDRVWIGYHPRAMAPLVVAVAAASLLVWTGQWYLDDLSVLAADLGWWATFAVAWGVWPAVALVFLYRTVTYTYRVTDRAVFVDYGPLFQPTKPVLLRDLDTVVAGRGWLARWLGVGPVVLRAGGRSVWLKGVRNPEAFARLLRAAKELLAHA